MKKRLLIIPSWQVWPLHSGGAHAQTAFLNELSDFLDIHMVITPSNTNSPDALAEAFPMVTFHMHRFDKDQKHPKNYKKSIVNVLTKITHKLTLSSSDDNTNSLPHLESEFCKLNNRLVAWYSVDKELGDCIETLDKAFSFDYIQYEMEYALPIFRGYKSPRAKNILVLHEVLSVIVEQYINRNPISNKQNGEDLLKVCQFTEKQVIDQFDKVIVFNPFDKNKLEESRVQTFVFCSPYVTKYTEECQIEESNGRDLIIVGSGFHAPNFMGTDWFLKDILPGIRQQIPNIKTYITGTWQLTHQHQFINDNQVIFTRNLPTDELNKLMQKCILVSPVFIGSGLRTKIIEGLRLGIPMVVHEMERNFMPYLSNKKNVLLASCAAEFSQQIILLASDNRLRQVLSLRAKETFNTYFKQEELLEKRASTYKN